MKWGIVVVMAFVAILAAAPATLVDRIVQEASGGELRVGQAEGSVWRGRGVVSAIDVGTRTWRTWHPVEWSFDPLAVFQGWIAWRLTVDGKDAARLEFGPRRWRVSQLEVDGPARFFLQRIPNPVAKLGWEGDIRLGVDTLECAWSGSDCDGHVSAQWGDAGCDVLPGQVFGDYAIVATGIAGNFKFDLKTQSGVVHIAGIGNFSAERQLSLAATVKGPPQLLSRLPAVAGPWAKPTDVADTWKIAFP